MTDDRQSPPSVRGLVINIVLAVAIVVSVLFLPPLSLGKRLHGRPTPTPAPTPISTTVAIPSASQFVIPGATIISPPAALARLEFTCPQQMVVDAPAEVTLEVIINPALTQTPTQLYASGVITISSSSAASPRYEWQDRVPPYPVMVAELHAPQFDITPTEESIERPLTTAYSAVWTWLVIPRKTGSLKLNIKVFGRTELAGQDILVPLRDRFWDVTVSHQPWPQRLLQAARNDYLTILGTGGPLALLVAWLKLRSDRQTKDQDRKLDDLRKQITYLLTTQPPSIRIDTVSLGLGSSALQQEYVRLRNHGPTLTLDGWTVSDLSQHSYTIGSLALRAGATLHIWTKAGRDTKTDLFWGLDHPIWSPHGHTAQLADGQGRPVHTYTYAVQPPRTG